MYKIRRGCCYNLNSYIKNENIKSERVTNIETADQVLPRGATPTQINCKNKAEKLKKCNVILFFFLSLTSLVPSEYNKRHNEFHRNNKKYLFAPFLHALEFSDFYSTIHQVIIRVFHFFCLLHSCLVIFENKK